VARGGRATVELHGNGTLDISGKTAEGLTIGSLSGDGLVFLGSRNLSIGSNNQGTTFSGIIQDGGADGGRHGTATKVGSGTLTLTGLNTYTGGTVVEEGTLLVKTAKGSATGPGPVQVNAGTFGGRSNLSGAVTVGSGSGSGAHLAPGLNGVGVLVIRNTVTFRGDGHYDWELNLPKGKSDTVRCNGATVESGAQFDYTVRGHRALATGTTFTVIDNRSGEPISGIFANLPEDAILNADGNNLQASYQGGDGNDLTLTVIP
jgi:autotransporter-associated beta strand protein